MVGVPGKSKGCSTCRRRKKGCDQKRPICGQCSASGYACGGYQRDLTFILHPSSKIVEKAIFLPTKPRSLLPSASVSLERTAVISLCRDLFFDVYLPRGRCENRDPHILRCGRPSNWTYLIRECDTHDTSLELAFAAFSISRVGRSKDDPRLVKESTKFYGKALKNLQKALYDPARMHTSQVLTACLLLGLYETFEGAGGKSVGWVSHAQGAARIVELRGPELHTERFPHLLFLGTRLPVIYSAILRRKRTFLSDEQWLTVPWRRELKTGLDRLVDIATHIPGVLEQLDSARATMPSSDLRQSLHTCLQNCRALQRSLQNWNTVRRPSSLPIAVRHEHTTGDTYPFDQELTFENHLFLNANLVQWLSNLVLATTISEVELLLTTLGFQSSNMLTQTSSAVQEAEDCASSIVQSIPYCLWPEMGDLGIDYIQFPMCLAFQFFMKSNNTAICNWMAIKANEIKKRGVSIDPSAPGTPLASDTPEAFMPFFKTTSYEPYKMADGGQEASNSTPNSASNAATVLLGVSEVEVGYCGVKPAAGAQNDRKNSPASGIVSTLDSDFDSEYDVDSEYETNSTPSISSGAATFASGRHNTTGGPSGSRAATTLSSDEAGDFDFVQENPGKYYIDRSEER